MTPVQLQRREALLTRNDAALDDWPDRMGSAFRQEMEAVARALEALAREADSTNGDRLERARTWRYAGNAYFDLGRGEDVPFLLDAEDAYRRAEALLEGIEDEVEQMKLNYCYGHTLLGLSESIDLQLASEAQRRYERALHIARKAVPAAVAPAERGLADARRLVALLRVSDDLTQPIDDLEEQPQHRTSPPENTPPPNALPLPAQLFDVLKNHFEAEKRKGTMDSIRQSGLEGVMDQLKALVERAEPNQSLQENVGDRGKLNDQVQAMLPRIQAPSFDAPVSDAQSRAARVLGYVQALKTYIDGEGLRGGKKKGEADKSIDLYDRLARLTTALTQAQDDPQKLHRLEAEEARPLAQEIQWYSRRRHLTVAHPRWSRRPTPHDPNHVFFAGSDAARQCLQQVAESFELTITPASHPETDPASAQWHDLATAGIAVFDLSADAPQVYYELGMALTLGTNLLLLAEAGTRIPFDVAQDVRFYAGPGDLQDLLTAEIDATLYGVQTKGMIGSSLRETLAYVNRLAAADPDNQMLHTALAQLSDLMTDPVKMRPALDVVTSYLGTAAPVPLYPRWPGVYPDPLDPRCFIVMPFREELDSTHAAVARACQAAGVIPVRGDEAEGQEIIALTWEEIGRATHVIVDLTGFNPNVCLNLGIADTLGRPTLLIGRAGTEKHLFPSLAKRRCHTYAPDLPNTPRVLRSIRAFLSHPI